MFTARNIPTSADADAVQHDLRTDDLDYDLPERLIATRPIDGPRDQARMMVVSRSEPSMIEHRRVRDLQDYLREGDALVFNTSAVARARLAGRRIGTGGRVEGLFLAEQPALTPAPAPAPGPGPGPRSAKGARVAMWVVMLRSNGRLRAGDRIELVDSHDQAAGVILELRQRMPNGAGEWIVALTPPCAAGEAADLLERIGRTPLPPYILRARGDRTTIADELDRAWYETVYADPSPDRRRSVAAPTAGLHFTQELLEQLDERGVQRLQIILHVGAGTFKPVTATTLAEHVMHSEWYEVPPATLNLLKSHANRRKDAAARSTEDTAAFPGGRIIAVGTTAVRTLESLPDPLPQTNEPLTGTTDLLIAPPYTFRHVDGLLTNFHLPRSTLLALVAAMIGLDRLKTLYHEAIRREYRFYSYGDCMLILP